jgi:thioredoxin-related protein
MFLKERHNQLSIIFLWLCSIVSPCQAQNANGIKFEAGLNFAQIKVKAKKEGKYIFVDTYTTWCGPCKTMAMDIFPQKKVGDVFNANFINLAVQLDTTRNDNLEVKKWYNDASLIKKEYKINVFPTYLFLNPDGVLMHIVIGSSSAEEFVENAQKALDPATQGINLLKEFERGRRDTSFLKLMIQNATSSHSDNRARYVQLFLKMQKNLLTEQNIRFIAQSVSSSKDIGYNILVDYPKEVNVIIGENWRNNIINDVIFNEYILPKLRVNGKKEVLNGGMFTYTGEIRENINWKTLQDSLQKKFSERSARLLINAKTTYYSWTNDWQMLNLILLQYSSIPKEGNDDEVLSKWLGRFANFCKEKEYLADVVIWADRLKLNEKNPLNIKYYGLVLYSLGKENDAVLFLKKYQSLLKKPDGEILKLINKIEKQPSLN